MSDVENIPSYQNGALMPSRGFSNITARNIKFSRSSQGQKADFATIKTQAAQLTSSSSKNMEDIKSSIPNAVEAIAAATTALESFAKPNENATEFEHIATVLPALSALKAQLLSREIDPSNQEPSAIDNLFVNTKNLVDHMEWFNDTYSSKAEKETPVRAK